MMNESDRRSRHGTFAGLAYASPDELNPGQCAAFGAPLASCPPRRSGCEFGPAAIRRASNQVVEPYSASPSRTVVDLDTGQRTRLSAKPHGLDLGDLPMDGPGSVYTLQQVASLVSRVVQSGGVPAMLGGDGRLLEGFAAGFSGLPQVPQVLVISPQLQLPSLTDAPVCNLCDVALLRRSKLVCAGVNGLVPAAAWAEITSAGGRIIPAEAIHRDAGARVADEIGTYLEEARACLMLIDMEVLDTGFAAGAPGLNVGGLEPHHLIDIVTHMAQKLPVAGIAVVNVAPKLDPRGHTEAIAATVIFQALRRHFLETVS